MKASRFAKDVPPGHKFALRAIKRKGEPVLKYSYPIGVASRPTSHAGDHVHTHNVQSGLRENLAEP